MHILKIHDSQGPQNSSKQQNISRVRNIARQNLLDNKNVFAQSSTYVHVLMASKTATNK